MNKSRMIIGSLSATALLLVGFQVSAQPVSESWATIDELVGPSGGPGSCPQVSWPLHLVGVSHAVFQDVLANGVHHYTVEVGVWGSATDAAGNSYVFAYENHDTFTDPLNKVIVTDHFNLEGPAGGLRVSFVVLVSTDANGNLVLNFKPNGDVSCDPI